MVEPRDTPGDEAPTQADDPVTVKAYERIQAELPGVEVFARTTGAHPFLGVPAGDLRAVCRLLRDDPALRYDCCHLISAVDWPEPDEGEPHIDVIYHLVSYVIRPEPGYAQRAEKNDPFLALAVRVPRDAPEVPTVMDIWIGADWHERETFDLMGVRFTGRAELPRILLPDDWPGHPLRKDWAFPASYHGVPIIPPEGL